MRLHRTVTLLGLALLLLACQSLPTPEAPTPDIPATVEAIVRETLPTAEPTSTVVPTTSPTPTRVPTPTPRPSNTPRPSPTLSPRPTNTPRPSPTPANRNFDRYSDDDIVTVSDLANGLVRLRQSQKVLLVGCHTGARVNRGTAISSSGRFSREAFLVVLKGLYRDLPPATACFSFPARYLKHDQYCFGTAFASALGECTGWEQYTPVFQLAQNSLKGDVPERLSLSDRQRLQREP